MFGYLWDEPIVVFVPHWMTGLTGQYGAKLVVLVEWGVCRVSVVLPSACALNR